MLQHADTLRQHWQKRSKTKGKYGNVLEFRTTYSSENTREGYTGRQEQKICPLVRSKEAVDAPSELP